MKTLALALSSALLMAGLVTGAFAQSTPAAPETKPSGESAAPAPSGDAASKDSTRANDKRPDMGPAAQDRGAAPMPGAETPKFAAPDVKTEGRTEVRPESAEGQASPRTSVEETRIFGLSPTAAVLVAAGIILVLVMGIIALSGARSDTPIDLDRR